MENSKQTRKGTFLGHALKAAAFLLILLAAVCSLTELMRNKEGDRYILLSKEMEKNTEWDVIFAGSSRVNTTVYPMEMYRDYGFTSWNNAQSGEILSVSYYTCRNIIRRCHPKVLALEVSMCYLDRKYGNLAWAHESLDPISPRERIPAILDLVPEKSREEFLFPLALYHDRWKELSAEDFTDSDTLRRGCSQVFAVAEDVAGMSLMDMPESETLRPGDVPVEYLDKIVDLCRETGTQLVLFYVPGFLSAETESLKPTHDMTKEPYYANWMEEYAREKGVDCVNFIPLMDQLGIDWWTHRYNYGHMNYWGGKRVTAYLGKYLSENYGLPDRREDPAYQRWNDDLAAYEALIERVLATADVQALLPLVEPEPLTLPDLPAREMIPREEYGDWVANQGVWLSKVNDEDVSNATELTVVPGTQKVKMAGWMADFWNDAPVKELYLQVGETILKCEYGGERKDVVERFGKEELRNCGFEVAFSAELLGEEPCELSFYGVSADGKYLYGPVTYRIEVGDAA